MKSTVLMKGALEKEVEPSHPQIFCKNKVKTVCKLGPYNVSPIVHTHFLLVILPMLLVKKGNPPADFDSKNLVPRLTDSAPHSILNLVALGGPGCP